MRRGLSRRYDANRFFVFPLDIDDHGHHAYRTHSYAKHGDARDYPHCS
jgi:hypothetical protein